MTGKKYVFADWSNVEPGYGTTWLDEKHPNIAPSGVRLRVHKPVIEPQPVLLPEMPWEGTCINGYATFLKIDGKIRLWYECFPDRTGYDDMDSLLAYAESDDGLHFTRPPLGLYSFRGSKENNLLKKVHGTSVLYDAAAPVPERYKLVWVEYVHGDPRGHWCRIHGAVSPDGLHFTDLEEPVLDNPGDTQNILDIDPGNGDYVLYTRQINGYPVPRRSIAFSRSRDFRHFPEPRMLLNSDPADPPDWDYYTSGYHPWPGAENAYVMLIDMFHRVEDTFDIHLATSTDGVIWYRPLGREAYIPNGESGAFNDKTICATKGIVDLGDGRWSLYLMCSRRGHNDSREDYPWLPYGGYWRALLREDGFISLSAAEKGEFHTAPLRFTGAPLRVNAAIPNHGCLRVGIFDLKTEAPVTGYTVADCDRLERDRVWQTVTWRGNGDLSGFAAEEKRYRLYFELYKTDLYAFSI